VKKGWEGPGGGGKTQSFVLESPLWGKISMSEGWGSGKGKAI